METEKRLIDANALSNAIPGISKDMKRPGAVELACLLMIAEAPTVDAVEVVHGRWEWMTEDMYNCTYCGAINHVKEVMGRPDFNYCPNCGADMRERKDNG